MKRKSIIRGRILGVGDRWVEGDNTTCGGEVTEWGYHAGMAELIFRAYWNGNGNKYLSAKWAIQFISDHQGLIGEVSPEVEINP